MSQSVLENRAAIQPAYIQKLVSIILLVEYDVFVLHITLKM